MAKRASARGIRRDVSGILRAPRRMLVADAVTEYMRVPMGAGNSVPWDPNLAPYVIEPMNCLASREYDAVVFVGPARTGKTIGLIDGWIVYSIVCDPADMLVIQVSEEKAREHSKKRLDRTFRCSPQVKSRLSPRRNDNNVHDRTFRAGNYLKLGWPSVNIMSSSDYKFVALTDYDRFPEDIDGEGDGFSLASKRTTTFMSSGMTLVESSPGRDILDTKWRQSSPHEAPPTTGVLSLYNRGDRRRLYWPCPHCGEYFQPEVANMTGYRDTTDLVTASEAAYLQCPACKGKVLPAMKRELNMKSVWLRDGQSIDRDGNITGEGRRSRIASFWMEGPAAAYQTWSQLIYKYLAAEQEYEKTQSEETLKTVVNTDFGRPYLPRASTEQRKSELLEQRAEDVPKRCVPDGVCFLVATVDVQGGRNRRFVVQVTGYGSMGERWLVDRYNIRQSLRCDANGESLPIDPASYPEDGSNGWRIAKDGSSQFNNVIVRGRVEANSGSFHGTIDATDGIFRGSVEANSFIGDIAAMSTFPGKSGSTWKSRIMHHDSSNKGGKSYAISGLIRWEAGNKSGYVTVDCYVNGQRVSTASYNGTDSGESARMRITACGVATGISTQDTLVEIVVSGTGTCHLEAGYCVMSRGSGSWEVIA